MDETEEMIESLRSKSRRVREYIAEEKQKQRQEEKYGKNLFITLNVLQCCYWFYFGVIFELKSVSEKSGKC
ncbi:unnamed protein product [Cochlearia groenlandica]